MSDDELKHNLTTLLWTLRESAGVVGVKRDMVVPLLEATLEELAKPREFLNVRVGVAVIVRRDDGRLIFGLRKGKHSPGTWCLPGGNMDFGEEPEATARRELLEETGLTVGEIQPYAVCPYVNSHFKATNKQYVTLYFTAEYLGGEPLVMEPEKCERWVWTSPDDLPSPLFEPIEANKLKLHLGTKP